MGGGETVDHKGCSRSHIRNLYVLVTLEAFYLGRALAWGVGGAMLVSGPP